MTLLSVGPIVVGCSGIVVLPENDALMSKHVADTRQMYVYNRHSAISWY